jgi:hypothetical protein
MEYVTMQKTQERRNASLRAKGWGKYVFWRGALGLGLTFVAVDTVMDLFVHDNAVGFFDFVSKLVFWPILGFLLSAIRWSRMEKQRAELEVSDTDK